MTYTDFSEHNGLMFTDNQCSAAFHKDKERIPYFSYDYYHFWDKEAKNIKEVASYLVRREPACLRVYLEVLVGGHDAVLDLTGGVELVPPGVSVLGLHLDHHRA